MTSQEEIQLKKLKDNLLITLGERVQQLRESKGLSQVDLASKMIGKFDTTNISRIESGRTNPTIFTLFRISEALEISLNEVLVFETPK
ncbi:helix-turn-helix domain-containing protein [Kordia sp.]|uniref:helix-turn-helix domain-containing protein n=1 Tax=Kordia sp. TaxID=1965332 RepID=UPI003B5B22D1